MIKIVCHEILLYSGRCKPSACICPGYSRVDIMSAQTAYCANDSKFGHLPLGFRPLLTFNTTQYGRSYIVLLRFVVNSASSISHRGSPVSFPRRIVPRTRKSIDRIGFTRAGMATIASKAIQPKRPPHRRLPTKSSIAAKLIDARSRPTPSPNSPSAARHRSTFLDLFLPSFDVSPSTMITVNKHSSFPIPCTTIRSTKF